MLLPTLKLPPGTLNHKYLQSHGVVLPLCLSKCDARHDLPLLEQCLGPGGFGLGGMCWVFTFFFSFVICWFLELNSSGLTAVFVSKQTLSAQT